MARKIGKVRNHRREDEGTEGRARSERRVMSGPEPWAGAAMRVRRWAGLGRPWGSFTRDREELVNGLRRRKHKKIELCGGIGMVYSFLEMMLWVVKEMMRVCRSV